MPVNLARIEGFARAWYDHITMISIQWGFFLAFVFVIALVFKKQQARFLYFIWLVGLMKVLVPPKIALPNFISKTSLIVPQWIPTLMLPEVEIASNQPAGLSFQGYLLIIWGSVVVGLLGYWLYQLVRFRTKVIGRGIELTDYHRLCFDIFGAKRVRLLVVPGISAPFTWGIMRPKIYLPEATLSWPDRELKALLLHEYAHINRKDLWIIPIQNILQILFFFHPLVWIANQQLSRYREQACDDFVIHYLQGRRVEYSKLLLRSIHQTASWSHAPALTSYFHQSKKLILQRFNYILNRKETVMIRLNLLQKLAIIAMIVLGVALSCQRQTETPQRESERREAAAQKTIPQQPQQRVKPGDTSSFFVAYDQPPVPIGGFRAIQEHLIYPEKAREAGIEGTAIIYVHVNVDGQIDSAKVFQSLDKIFGCDEAAMAALKAVKWLPAKQKGQPVAVWVSVPVGFKLHQKPTEKLEQIEVFDREGPPPPPPQPPTGAEMKLLSFDEPPIPEEGFEAIQKNLVYPESARVAKIEGMVIVNVHINDQGEVRETKVFSSTVDDACNNAAMEAIRSVKWKPAKLKGKPVDTWIHVPVRFKLK
ncbi:MAG: M56 family metallopeptidase [candidate division KSB1 bacterium]|nr:M56 family metallopeptidase [candidate division KSB1 bacterium]